MVLCENKTIRIEQGFDSAHVWQCVVKSTGTSMSITAPVFEINGAMHRMEIQKVLDSTSRTLSNSVVEHTIRTQVAGLPDLVFTMIFRLAPDNGVVRFQYQLSGTTSGYSLTKNNGRDTLTYAGFSLSNMPSVNEVRFSEFNELYHSFVPTETRLESRHFENGVSAMGPMLTAEGNGHAMLLAYEHGSQVPDAFLQFELSADRSVMLRAVKGNYYGGQPLNASQLFCTIWFDFALVPGTQTDLAAAFREFVLLYMSQNKASRRPYIFYNTWAWQERNKWYNGQFYLDGMNQERVLADIDAAHKMGIEVFVIDTGWYEKTGDWRVSLKRFPDGLKAVREKLAGYGMRLGLWFDPTVAAVSSELVKRNETNLMSMDGTVHEPASIWETEPSNKVCLVSEYADDFADELIRLHRELGVTHFKWDAISQYGCDDPHHWHGTDKNTAQERGDCYAFQLIIAMNRTIDRLCEACPDAEVHFDITEGGRAVGLAFLAAGKYFLINNGPYFGNFDIPTSQPQWTNIFVHPGPARTWICRVPYTFDKWVPSVLFLTHYLPDDPPRSQVVNIASLILGNNGIWGDLQGVSAEGIELFNRHLGLYKQIRGDLTESTVVITGPVGGSPEIYEKISVRSGRGAVCLFSSCRSEYTYITQNKVCKPVWHSDDVSVTYDAAGRAVIRAKFDGPEWTPECAKIVFFGAQE